MTSHDSLTDEHRMFSWLVLLGARLGGLAGELVERRRSTRLLAS